MSVFSERILQLRKTAGLSQSKAAKKIGLPTSTIAHYEVGDRSPNIDALQLLADFYGVSIDYLLGREEDYKPRLTPGQQLLFQASANATEDEIRLVIKLLEALRK